MSYLGDTLTVGLILILLFGSIALYLYTRIQQTEQKVSLLESIVLDLKLTGEIQGFGELPVDSSPHYHSTQNAPTRAHREESSNTLEEVKVAHSSPAEESYTPFHEDESVEQVESFEPLEPLEPLEPSASVGSTHPLEVHDPLRLEEVSVSPVSEYDHMTMKEIQGLVRSRGLTFEKGAKKSTLIELLKRADMSAEVKPGSTSSSSFVDTSESIQDANE